MNKVIKAAIITAFATLSMTASATLLVNPAMSVQQLSTDSDDVVVGNVLSVEPRVVDRSFETSYQIAVSEAIKSNSGDYTPGKVFTMTLPGASLTTPPITQYVSAVPYMAKGEQVLLFLKKSNHPAPDSNTLSRSNQPVSLLPSSPKVVGWNQGSFTVFTNPQTGKKMVTRLNMEDYGLLNSPAAAEELVKSLETNQIKVIETKIARGKDTASQARVKDPLELTSKDSSQLNTEKAIQRAQVVKQLRQRGGVPAQDLESFKQDILQFSNQ